MELYIYSPALVSQGVIDTFSSFRWRRRYFAPGEFELHCAATVENLAMLAEGNIVHRLDRREAGVIEGAVISESESGDEIEVTGRFLSSELENRIIAATLNYSGTAEVAMRKIVSDNAVTARPISGLTLGALNGFTQSCSFQTTGKGVLSVLEALSTSSTIGFMVRIDIPNKRKVFETYQGIDRTVTQQARPYVLFSSTFNNISSPKYTLSNVGYKNFAYVAGEGDGANRTVVTVDQTNGAQRREMWVDARDLQSSVNAESDFAGDGSTVAYTLGRTPDKIQSANIGGTSTSDYTLSGNVVTFKSVPAAGAAIAISYTYTMTSTEYAAALTQRGIEKLAEAPKTESFEAAAANAENFEYLTDWDLGDIVSFEKWGILLNQRVTEVEEVYENEIMTVTPTCGTPLPTMLDLGSDT